MRTQHLHDIWSSPDNSRLVSKQFSFRLPVHIAAKIAALGEMYPQKNRTQVVADLLTAALDDLEKNLPQALGLGLSDQDAQYEKDMSNQLGIPYEPLYSLWGTRGQFREKANQHYRALEKELGNESPGILYPEIYITEKDLKAK